MVKNITLTILLVLPIFMCGQIQYGNNSEVGKYVQTSDAQIYYETYGKGEPLLLIHGSLYGYISEFKHVLPKLADKYKVIAVALRGHGKSEIGNRDYSYDLFAEDMIKVLEAEKIDSVAIIGFSSGAITAIRIAATYPEKVTKVVSIAGALGVRDKNPEKLMQQKAMTGDEFVVKLETFVNKRKELMPEPDRFVEFYEKLKVAHTDSIWISDELASQITSPVLIVGGDRDGSFPVQAFLRMYNIIPNSSLLVIPNSGHIDVLKNNEVYINYALPFLEGK